VNTTKILTPEIIVSQREIVPLKGSVIAVIDSMGGSDWEDSHGFFQTVIVKKMEGNVNAMTVAMHGSHARNCDATMRMVLL
jgi:hypothetical protein